MSQTPDKEFEQMRWNIVADKAPIKVTFPDLYERFIEFEKQSFEAELSFDMVIRYIVLAYHIKSPLVTKKMEVEIRKEKALVLAGFEKEGMTWDKDVRDVIYNQNDLVLNMVIQFCQFERNMRFSNLMMLYERQFVMQKNSMQFDSKVKGSDLTDLLDLIESEEDKVFGDGSIGNHVAALQIIEKRTYVITPEQQSKAQKEKRSSKK